MNDARVRHHFYDPIYNRALTVGIALGQKAPDWSLGAKDFLVSPPQPDNIRLNHYTVFDAREAMYRALTGRDSQGNALQPAPGGTLTHQADLRNAYWASTFRALGDVVHLIQDMGQPQHTRNDPHSGVPGFGHESVFEKYIDARAAGAQSYQIDGTPVTPVPLNYGGYPIPAFTKYSDFWSTSPGNANVPGNRLADYANRGFFSLGTDLGLPLNQG